MSAKTNNKLVSLGFIDKLVTSCYSVKDVDAELSRVTTQHVVELKELSDENMVLKEKIRSMASMAESQTSLLTKTKDELESAKKETVHVGESQKKRISDLVTELESCRSAVKTLKEDKVTLNREHKEAIASLNASHSVTNKATTKAAADAMLKADKDPVVKSLRKANSELNDELEKCKSNLAECKGKLNSKVVAKITGHGKVKKSKMTEAELTEIFKDIKPAYNNGKPSFECKHIKALRKLYDSKKLNKSEIARYLDVASSTISRIVKGETYTKCK